MGAEFTCEDLALSLIIDFASENGLPFQFKNQSGVFDAASDDFNSVESFKTNVMETTGAKDLADPANTRRVKTDEAAQGDMILLAQGSSPNINHTQIVTSVDQENIQIRQGNLNYRLLSNNPNSSLYGGVPIQSGSHNLATGQYNNFTTGSSGHFNLSDYPKNQIRRWRFSLFSKPTR